MNWLTVRLQRWVCPHQIMRRLGGPRLGGRYELGGTATWRCCDCGAEMTMPMEWSPPQELLMPGQHGESVIRMRGCDDVPFHPNCRGPFMWDEPGTDARYRHDDAVDAVAYLTGHERLSKSHRLMTLYKRGGEHWTSTL